jgi:hypothetical protein
VQPMCVDRLIPLRRERTVSIAMPEIKTLADARSASWTLVTACLNGEISPAEAKEMLSIISEHFKICELSEFEQKLQALEARLQTVL